MAKSFDELRAKMTPEARERAERLTAELRKALDLGEPKRFEP